MANPPDLKVNDMQLQTANLSYIFDGKIVSVTANKYGIMTIIVRKAFPNGDKSKE